MSNRAGYVGAYLNEALKERFVESASEAGLNQTDYLTQILEEHLEAGVEPEVEEVEDDALWGEIPTEVEQHLNFLIVRAYEDIPQGEAYFYEVLAAALNNAANAPIPEQAAESEPFDELLEEELSEPLIELIAEQIEALPEVEQAPFFRAIADRLNEQADEMRAEEQQIFLEFSREEWYYLQQLLPQYNEDYDTELADVSDLVRHQLGVLLAEAGAGFLWDTNPEMVRVGEAMRKAV